MPFLLDEILEATLLSFADDDKTSYNKTIEKFMISGKRPFEIVVNYFMQADRVLIDEKCFTVFVKGKCWEFSNNFVFASLLSKVAAISLQKLSINLSNENVVLDNLLVNGVKDVQVLGDIHEKYLDQMHLLQTLHSVEFRGSKIRFEDLILTKSLKTQLVATIDFQEMIKDNSQNIVLPNVHDLTLRGRFVSFDMNNKLLKQFNANIFTVFNNLQKISICYTTTHSSWKEIFDVMNTLTSNIFEGVITNAVGEIRFEYSEWNVLLSDVIEKVYEEEEVEIKKTDSSLKRIIQVNHNLSFNFSLYFRKSERKRRRFK